MLNQIKAHIPVHIYIYIYIYIYIIFTNIIIYCPMYGFSLEMHIPFYQQIWVLTPITNNNLTFLHQTTTYNSTFLHQHQCYWCNDAKMKMNKIFLNRTICYCVINLEIKQLIANQTNYDKFILHITFYINYELKKSYCKH